MALKVKKVIQKPKFQVSARLKIEVGIDVEAGTLTEAVEKANSLGITDIIDFKALGLEHNDSEKPEIIGVFRY